MITSLPLDCGPLLSAWTILQAHHLSRWCASGVFAPLPRAPLGSGSLGELVHDLAPVLAGQPHQELRPALTPELCHRGTHRGLQGRGEPLGIQAGSRRVG